MTRMSGLGRGLDALIPAAAPGQSGYAKLRLSAIVPNRQQPRGAFEQQRLEELAQSLQQVGVLQPILVRPLDEGRYELIAGERRFRAARLAGFDDIPAIIRHTADDQLLTEALVENIHRVDLNPLEEAAAYQQLLDDFGLTHDQLAERLGKSRPAITNTLRLLQLTPELQHHVVEGRLRSGHARALLGIQDPLLRERIAARVVADELSVRATEDLVRSVGEPQVREEPTVPEGASTPRHPYRHMETRLGDALSTKVSLTGDAERGRIVIEYSGSEDFQRLLAILGQGAGTNLASEDG